MSFVHYRIEISEKALKQLRTLPKEMRRNIGQRLETMRDDLRGDVLKLRDKGNRYRLRVGSVPGSLRSGGRCDPGLCCQRSKGSL